MQYREAIHNDIPALVDIRGKKDNTEEYWVRRITGYMDRVHHPQKALMPRVIYLAIEKDTVAGFIAGHLTERFACDGELEWIDAIPEYQGRGVAFELLKLLAQWFAEQGARKVCVDPGNDRARRFYTKHGAVNLNQHWMVWEDIGVVITSPSGGH